MTNITDQQRREVAERLRKGDEETGVPLVIDGMALADLIDRPTCRAVLCHGGMYGCTRCGFDGWCDAESVTRYCPECGAEVAG